MNLQPVFQLHLQKRNDRKEILRRLAMGPEFDMQHNRADKPQRKPSLHSRLQGGMNSNSSLKLQLNQTFQQ